MLFFYLIRYVVNTSLLRRNEMRGYERNYFYVRESGKESENWKIGSMET